MFSQWAIGQWERNGESLESLSLETPYESLNWVNCLSQECLFLKRTSLKCLRLESRDLDLESSRVLNQMMLWIKLDARCSKFMFFNRDQRFRSPHLEDSQLEILKQEIPVRGSLTCVIRLAVSPVIQSSIQSPDCKQRQLPGISLHSEL